MRRTALTESSFHSGRKPNKNREEATLNSSVDNLSPIVGGEIIYVIMPKIVSHPHKVIGHAANIMWGRKKYYSQIQKPK
jgi:hypothetical protein